MGISNDTFEAVLRRAEICTVSCLRAKICESWAGFSSIRLRRFRRILLIFLLLLAAFRSCVRLLSIRCSALCRLPSVLECTFSRKAVLLDRFRFRRRVLIVLLLLAAFRT